MHGLWFKAPNKSQDIMYVKIHHTKYRDVVAICDKDLIGKKFSENNLELNISERFYKGNNLDDEEVIIIMKNSEALNIVGKKSVELAIKNNIVSKNQVITIQGIPYAQYCTL